MGLIQDLRYSLKPGNGQYRAKGHQVEDGCDDDADGKNPHIMHHPLLLDECFIRSLMKRAVRQSFFQLLFPGRGFFRRDGKQALFADDENRGNT